MLLTPVVGEWRGKGGGRARVDGIGVAWDSVGQELGV